MARFPFTDLHSFKDYVTFVRLCAPDSFPAREGLRASDQWTLDLAFDGIRYGLDLSEQQGAKPAVISRCRELVAQALPCYRSDSWREGYLLIKELEKIIKKLPSQ